MNPRQRGSSKNPFKEGLWKHLTLREDRKRYMVIRLRAGDNNLNDRDRADIKRLNDLMPPNAEELLEQRVEARQQH